MTIQYLVTVTSERDTFHWVFSDRDEAQKLVDLGVKRGGDFYWDLQPLYPDMPADQAYASFVFCIEE